MSRVQSREAWPINDIGERSTNAKFPDYTAQASPAPLSVEEVQAQLAADEALMAFLDTPKFKPTPERPSLSGIGHARSGVFHTQRAPANVVS
jgi:hypothetical protein